MPNNTKKRKNYDIDTLLRAVAAVSNGMTYKEASVTFGVPVASIADKKNSKYAPGKNKPGSYIRIIFFLFLYTPKFYLFYYNVYHYRLIHICNNPSKHRRV